MATPHDQLLKETLRAFLIDFVTLFAPDQAAELDFSTLTFLDKELFTDLATGSRRELDLLAEVRTRSGQLRMVLIHVEVQRLRRGVFAVRMFRYFLGIAQRFPDHLILPMALLSYSLPAGQGVSIDQYVMAIGSFDVVRYQYIAISLPQLDPLAYLERPQPLAIGLAALMGNRKRVQRDRLYELCLRQLTSLEHQKTLDDAHLFLLQNMVRTYLPLSEAERRELLMRLQQEGATDVVTTEMTWADRMRAEGEARGRIEGKQTMLQTMLSVRFGPLPTDVMQRIAEADEVTLDILAVQAITATSLADLFPQ